MISRFHCRTRCDVPHAECKAANHEVSCVCKEGFHGNGTESCVPDGFTEEENGTKNNSHSEICCCCLCKTCY